MSSKSSSSLSTSPIQRNILSFSVHSNNNNQTILYSNLVYLTNHAIHKNQEILKADIEKIMNNEGTHWNTMINFKEFVINEIDAKIGPRQDDEKVLTFPNKLSIDVKRLESLRLKDFYNSRVYLSNLQIIGRALNEKFHATVENVLLADDKDAIYRPGPLKGIERSQAKSETDYAGNLIHQQHIY